MHLVTVGPDNAQMVIAPLCMSFVHSVLSALGATYCSYVRVHLGDAYVKSVYSKTCIKRLLKMKTKIGFQDRLSLNAGQKDCRMLQESILQYFRPSLSYHTCMSVRYVFCLFVSDRFRQVLLYFI